MSDYLRRLRERVGHDLLLVPSATVVAFDDRGRVLLVQHAEGRWVAPGGAIEPHETPADAAVRETFEETGLHVELVRLLGVFGGPAFQVRYRNGDLVSYVTTVFEGRVLGGRLRPDGDETLAVGWFAAEELPSLGLTAWARGLLAEILADPGRPRFQAATWSPPGGEPPPTASLDTPGPGR